jgi:YbbR domain-containing protein
MSDPFRRRIFHNFGLKILSLILAVGLWLAVARDPVAEVAVNVPIEFQNIPQSLEINTENVPTAQVRVRGPARLIRQLRSNDVHVQVDLTGAQPGERTFDLTARQIREPRDLEVVQVVPSQFHISFDARSMRQVEVRPRVTGSFASGLRVAKVVADPSTITIMGPRTRVERLDAASTDPIDASGVMTSQSFSTNVYVADPLIQVVHPVPIRVTVMMEKVPGGPAGN